MFMKTYSYNVKRLGSYCTEWRQEAAAANLECFPWPDAIDYRPVTSARLAFDGKAIFVFMETNETNLRMQARGFSLVHTDSCMEFFFSPDPKNSSYLNFEFNPAGAMYLSIGTSRFERTEIPQENYQEYFNVKTAINGNGWNLEFHIPLSFIQQYFPAVELKPGYVMRGNFYKCGDNTARPHYGCWSPIDLPSPNFHCPDFFGKLIF